MKKAMLLLFLLALTAHAGAQGVSDEATAQAVTAFTTGQEAVQKNDLATGIPALEKALALNPELFVAHYWLGLAYVAKQDPLKAAEHLGAFIQKPEADPNQVAHARNNLVVVLLRDKKYPEAAPHLQKLVEGKPDNVDLRLQLADTLFKAKDEAGAEAQLVKVTELDPKRPMPFFLLGRMAYQRKDDEVAKQRLTAFVALAAEGAQAGQAFFMLGQIARRASDNEAAKGHFEKYLATNPPAGPQVEAIKQFLASLSGTPAPAPAP